MKRYPIYEMLTEGRDAPLYHATPILKFFAIMKSNELQAKTSHKIIRWPDVAQWVKGVSLTRDFRFAKKFAEDAGKFVVIELDQRKLAQNYEFVPFDYFSKNSKYKRAEAEEFVIGPIKNLRKYIVAVHANEIIDKDIADNYPSIEVKTIK